MINKGGEKIGETEMKRLDGSGGGDTRTCIEERLRKETVWISVDGGS